MRSVWWRAEGVWIEYIPDPENISSWQATFWYHTKRLVKGWRRQNRINFRSREYFQLAGNFLIPVRKGGIIHDLQINYDQPIVINNPIPCEKKQCLTKYCSVSNIKISKYIRVKIDVSQQEYLSLASDIKSVLITTLKRSLTKSHSCITVYIRAVYGCLECITFHGLFYEIKMSKWWNFHLWKREIYSSHTRI